MENTDKDGVLGASRHWDVYSCFINVFVGVSPLILDLEFCISSLKIGI